MRTESVYLGRVKQFQRPEIRTGRRPVYRDDTEARWPLDMACTPADTDCSGSTAGSMAGRAA